MPGLVLHLGLGAEPPNQGLIDHLHHLLAILQLYNVPIVILAECTNASTAMAVMQLTSLSSSKHNSSLVRCIPTQPSQAYISLRAAINHLNLPPPQITFISLSPTSTLTQAAISLDLVTAHFPLENEASTTSAVWTTAALQNIATIAASLPPPPSSTNTTTTTTEQQPPNTSAATIPSTSTPALLRVGYLMKPSRELALHKSQLLSLLPTNNNSGNGNICFLPLSVDLPLDQQPPVDLILHKMTDYLIEEQNNIHHTDNTSSTSTIISPSFLNFLSTAQQVHNIPILDPIHHVARVMDRTTMSTAIESACVAVRKKAVPAGCPPSIEVVDSFSATATVKKLRSAGIDLPCVVKTRVACGVAEAHQMAFVLHPDGFEDLEVPVPAIVQSYSDHGGIVWKVYCIGEHVCTVQKKSTPDLAPLVAALAANPALDMPTSIHFDSLHSLPVALPKSMQTTTTTGNSNATNGNATDTSVNMSRYQYDQDSTVQAEALVRPEYLQAMAKALQKELELTVFGFDVVFDLVAGEIRVVDVNYFPSCSGLVEAPVAFQEAVRTFYSTTSSVQGK